MMRTLICLCMGSAMALAGCSGGTDTSQSQAGQIETLYSTFRAATRAPAPLPQLTPALIDSLTVSSLEIVIEDRGATAFLVPFSDRTDARPGALRTWRTADDANIILRSGVLVTTRGLGDDIGSSDAAATVRAVQTRSPVSGPRRMFVRDGDNGTDLINLSCSMTSLGDQAISIVETRRTVIRLQETCTGAASVVTNDYWVDRSDGTLWQSRQWAGPKLGYIRTRLLKK